MEFDPLSRKVIGLAIEVHRALGPGLLESSYEKCLGYELRQNGIQYLGQMELPVLYKGVRVECGYRVDLMVEDSLIVELKCVDKLTGVHEAQLLTYMKLANVKAGLLINFNSRVLKTGIRRFVL
jgi:GxxExxY protein